MKNFILTILCFVVISCGSTEDWEPLFNGQDLEGWHIYLRGNQDFNGWYVEDGVLAFDPSLRQEASNSDLVTDRQYTNFELSIEWMISAEGNSGIFWGVQEDTSYSYTYETGPEIQVLDDNWRAYVQERGDIQRAGSLFNIIAPSQIVSKPAGEWNHYLLHIDHKNNEGFVVFNQVEIMRFPVNGPAWDTLVSNSNFKGWPGFGKAQTGHIALQDHGSQVAFREIKIRELK